MRATPRKHPPSTCDTGFVRYDGLRPYGAPGAEAGPRGSDADGGTDDVLPDSLAKVATLPSYHPTSPTAAY